MRKTDEIAPRGLSLIQAAAYWGVSPGSFKSLVKRGLAPDSMKIPGLDRIIWDKDVLDRAWDALRDGVAA
jgi:hypothetical protein